MFNSRYPGPRRVWKGGSEQQFLTPLWRASGRSRRSVGSAGSGGEFPKTCFGTTLHHFWLLFRSWSEGRARPDPDPDPDLWRSSESPWGSSGKVWMSFGRTLGGSLYRQTPDPPPRRPASNHEQLAWSWARSCPVGHSSIK